MRRPALHRPPGRNSTRPISSSAISASQRGQISAGGQLLELPYGENPHQRAAYYTQVGARAHVLSQVAQLGGHVHVQQLVHREALQRRRELLQRLAQGLVGGAVRAV